MLTRLPSTSLPMIGIWVRLLGVPYRILYLLIVVICAIGVYSVNNSSFDVYMTVGFSLLGYVLRKLDAEPAPLLMGFVLGPMVEENFRRSMITSHGDLMVFLQRPISHTGKQPHRRMHNVSSRWVHSRWRLLRPP